jgi:hypothetical protein
MVAKEVQEFASAVSAAGLANHTFMAIAATAPEAASTNNFVITPNPNSPRGPILQSNLQTASSNTSSTFRTMGSGQLGISAAGIIAPLRSSDYGTVHVDWSADHSNRSSATGDATIGRHRWRPGSRAAGFPGVAATAEEPGEDEPVVEPASEEDDSTAGEPQFWLSPLPERQQQQLLLPRGCIAGYDSYNASTRTSLSASTAADSMQPVLHEGLSKWPSAVCQPEYDNVHSRESSESFTGAAATRQHQQQQQQQLFEASMAAANTHLKQQQEQWQQQQQQLSAQVQELLHLQEASGEGCEEQQQQEEQTEKRGSAAGAAVSAAGAAAAAAFGGLKDMLGELSLFLLLLLLLLLMHVLQALNEWKAHQAFWRKGQQPTSATSSGMLCAQCTVSCFQLIIQYNILLPTGLKPASALASEPPHRQLDVLLSFVVCAVLQHVLAGSASLDMLLSQHGCQ